MLWGMAHGPMLWPACGAWSRVWGGVAREMDAARHYLRPLGGLWDGCLGEGVIVCLCLGLGTLMCAAPATASLTDHLTLPRTGLGTLDELFAILTMTQVGLKRGGAGRDREGQESKAGASKGQGGRAGQEQEQGAGWGQESRMRASSRP